MGDEWMGYCYAFEHFRERCFLFAEHIPVLRLMQCSRFCQSVDANDDGEGHDEGS